MVEFFSPYCGHCKNLAPKLQTLYEFYYTEKPILASNSQTGLNSFSRYYNFNFGKVDCVAFGTACSEHGISSFPTLIMYKDGKEIKKSVGDKSIEKLFDFMEETLDSIKPGSRPPKDKLVFPKVGDHSVEVPKSIVVTKFPNSAGQSVALNPASFEKLVTHTRDPWFVKFHVPWCHHCQALAPAWSEMAREMKGKMNVGDVNCEVEKRLCKEMGVKGYPTLLYFQGMERIEYEGLRGLGDLLKFARQAVDARVVDVDEAAFEEMEKTEEVIFLYLYDHATTSEDFRALERLTLPLIGHAKLVKTNDTALYKRFKVSTWPRLLVSRDTKPSYYPPISPREMRDVRKLLDWMQSVWLPIVPELTASNAHDIMDNRIVVLGILSRERGDEFVIGKREIKNAALEWVDKQIQAFQLERQELRDAKQLRIEEAEDRNDQRALRAAKSIRIDMDSIERKEVGFAWVDGVFWQRWVKTTYGIDVKDDGERVIVNDEEVSTSLQPPRPYDASRIVDDSEPTVLGHNNHR